MKCIGQRKEPRISPGQCLDMVQTAHWDRIYPLIYCHLVLEGHLDVDRLIRAVDTSSGVVPELLGGYDLGRGCFVDLGHRAEEAVYCLDGEPEEGWRWDLGSGPQLRIWIRQWDGGARLVVGMSHILCDGAGFLQYLYLLAELYNGQSVPEGLTNSRSLNPELLALNDGPPTEQERWGKGAWGILPRQEQGEQWNCLHRELDEPAMTALYRQAKGYGATLNDVFLAAYGRVVARLLCTDRVVLPCPGDLRRLVSSGGGLTIGNMTGMYKLALSVAPRHRFTDTLQQVQIEMQLQKCRRRCLAGVRALHRAGAVLPPALLNRLVRVGYTVRPVSYTNLGVIDHDRLAFAGCRVVDCMLTGTYRKAPDVQLSVSTFRGRAALSCTLLGNAQRRSGGQQVLAMVERELLDWITEEGPGIP